MSELSAVEQLAIQLRDQSQTAVVAKLVADELAAMGKAAKGELLPTMQALGTSQQTVTAADGVKMATVSMAGGTAKPRVVDERAFLEWVLEHHPGEIVQSVRESFVKALLARADKIGEPVDFEGRVVPGIEFEARPYLTVRPTTAGRERMSAVLSEAGWMRQLPGAFSSGGPG